MSQETTENALLSGPVRPALLRFAGPIILTMVATQLYSVADTMIVGLCLDADALAAVSNASTVLMVFLFVSGGMELGGQLGGELAQPVHLRVADLNGIDVDDRLNAELPVELPLDVVDDIVDLHQVGVGGHLGVDAHHPPARAVVVDDQIVDAHHLAVAEDHVLDGLDGFRLRGMAQQGI